MEPFPILAWTLPWPEALGIGTMAHLLVFLGVALHCLTHPRDPRSTILWLFTVWGFPVVGALLYAAFGVAALALGPQYRLGTASNMGPGYFPTVLGGLLFPRQIIACFLQPGESFELAVRYLRVVAPGNRPIELPMFLVRARRAPR